MPDPIAAIKDAALQGMNAVIMSASGVGAASKIRHALDTAGLRAGGINLAHYAGIYLGSPCRIGSEIWLQRADTFLESEVLVLDHGDNITAGTFDVIVKLMCDRIVYQTSLPKSKSVIVIFNDDPRGYVKRLSQLSNTVSVKIS